MKKRNSVKKNFKNLSKLFYAFSDILKILRTSELPKELHKKKKKYNFNKTNGFLLFEKHCKLKNYLKIRKKWYFLKEEDKIRYERLAKKIKNLK